MLKKASKKPVFRCGTVHHKVGSPYHKDISYRKYAGHAKKNPPFLQSMKDSSKEVIFTQDRRILYSTKLQIQGICLICIVTTFLKGCKKCEYNILCLLHSSILTGYLSLNECVEKASPAKFRNSPQHRIFPLPADALPWM